MKKILLCLILLLLLSAQSYADVVLDCKETDRSRFTDSQKEILKDFPEFFGSCSILIKGTILQEDLSTFRRIINSLDKKRGSIKTTRGEYNFMNTVLLNSSGGDAITALAIGDLIYKNQFSVIAESCSSSCVFILGSSMKRFVRPMSEVKIHRPYSVDTGRSYEQIKSDFANLEKIAVFQFKRVGISPDLWNVMMSIPPEKARRLTVEEMNYFGLNRNDPAYDDAFDSSIAKSLGITKQEYLRRKAISDRCYQQEMSKKKDDSDAIRIFFNCLEHAGLKWW